MRRALRRIPHGSLLAVLFTLLVGLATPARAVVIASGTDGPNTVAPGNDPGWLNVGHVSNASGVYLGNRWVLTASHVGADTLTLSDGRVFNAAPGTGLLLSNPTGVAGTPDLGLYRLTTDPGLPSLTITDTSPDKQLLTMIGAGRDREEQLIGWKITQSPTGASWESVPLAQATVRGFNLTASESTMRWGTNQVYGSAAAPANGGTIIFSTRFDQGGTPYEAQATPGDSGGGVFQQINGQWELAGIMLATGPLTNQPANTVVFAGQTLIADLASYRQQILDIINKADPAWQNQTNKFDVSATGRVDPRDVLLIVTELQRGGTRDLTGAPGTGGFYYDVNGDGRLTQSDLAQLTTALQGGTANPQASPLVGMLVPEPSSVAIAISGGISALMFWALARRRK